MSSPFPRAARAAAAAGTVAVAALALVLVLPGAPAGAHGDTGQVTVVAAEPAAAPLTVHLEVGVVHRNDGDLAEEATVSAALTGPGGAAVGPVPLEHRRGARYGADVAVPAAGPWTVTVTAADPTGTATAEVTVPTPPPPTTAAPTTVAPTTTTAPTTTATAAPPAPAPDTPTPLVAGGGAVVLVASAGAAYAVTRRRLAP